MLHAPLIFLAGGALGLLARPAVDERRERKKKEQAQQIALAIAEALKSHSPNS